MRNIIIFLLSILLCLPLLASCKEEPDFYGEVSLVVGEEKQEEGSVQVKLVRYDWSGYGVSYKTIESCQLADEIVEIISAMDETMKVSMMKALGDLEDYGNNPPVDRGTSWVEIGSELYRLDPEMTEISIVKRHLGAGKMLDSDSSIDRLGDLLYDAWYYHPYDYYSGTYDNSTGTISLERMYEAESGVEISVKDFDVKNESGAVNTVTVEVTAKKDIDLRLILSSQQSDDNIGLGDRKEFSMKKGKKKTVTLSFSGWDSHSYWIDIKADNTVVSITINP